MNILCKFKEERLTDGWFESVSLCVCVRERETEVDRETEVVYEVPSTCACSASESVAVCLFACLSHQLWNSIAYISNTCSCLFGRDSLLLNAKAISTELWQMMGFINQCHSVCKAFKLGFQSQNFGQVIAQLTLLDDNPLQPTHKKQNKKNTPIASLKFWMNWYYKMWGRWGGIQTMAALDH